MTDETRKLAAFIGVLWIAVVAIFLRSLPLAANADWLDFAVFVLLAALAERWYVGTSQESGMSLSFTVHFAAAVLFGPAFAMLAAIGGLAITDGLIRRPPLVRTAFNIAQMAVAVGLCGFVYRALRVDGPIDLVADAPALALGALVYLVVNDSLVAAVLSIRGRSFFQEWRLSFKDILLPYASMAPLGALAAYVYQSTPWALLYFPPLVLVVYDGFKLFVSLQRETDDALVALADSIDRRDQYTSNHSLRVAARVEATARKLGLAPREIDLIVAAARVHDLGKIATDNRLLLKPTPLTPDERRLIERHAEEGEEIAGRFSMFEKGRRFIRHHHERWDGTGYPDGLAATRIPLGARIIAVADSYDAMTSDRPYRKALQHEVAVMELHHCAGTQFDPAIVQAFIEAFDGECRAAATPAQQLQPWQPGDVIAELSDRRDSARLWAAASVTLSRMLDVPHCDVHRLDEDGSLVCAASMREGEWYPESLGKRADLALWATGRAAMTTRKPVLISSPSDSRLSGEERADMIRWHETAVALVPLIVRDEMIGLVEVGESREGRTLTCTQAARAESICQLIALAVHDAGAVEVQKLHARRLASLLESSRAIATAKGTEEALAIVTRKAVELLDLNSCIAYEYDDELDAIVARAQWERTPSEWNRLGEPLALAELSVERELLASGRALLECLSDPELDPVSRATMEMWGEKSCLTVPMQSVDGPMGLLTLWDSACERHYSEDELALASSLAELAGEAVRGAKLLRRLRRLSETDSLTGLANHRKIHEFLALVQARAERYGSHFSLAMLDIDNFKLLNDTHGHPAGDVVLRQVAALLTEQTRAADIVGRYGGDEFLLILPEAGPLEAAALAEKLRAALAENPYVTPAGEQIPLCASFGIAAYPEDGRDPNELVAVADANLYASKRRGGDAVTGSEENPPGQLESPPGLTLAAS
jgi:diguanylate cyclase (GGDEF)-like protein/putative nucleotidyltransferase with HDIG domain